MGGKQVKESFELEGALKAGTKEIQDDFKKHKKVDRNWAPAVALLLLHRLRLDRS